MSYRPLYLETYEKGILKDRIEKAFSLLSACKLCPRQCNIDRQSGDIGVCKTGVKAIVASFDSHFGEESPLVGKHGSGTIFFSYCNMLCNFCQNYEISHKGEGQEVEASQLAFMMLQLQKQGCHNINFVTPSHVVPQILEALPIAIEKGLSIPLVYNTGGYDSVSTLKLLEGIVDIYMPDFKFYDSNVAKLVGVPEDYPEIAKKAIIEMYRQVGDLQIDKSGIANQGILLRHLVLPEGNAGTRDVMRFIVQEISSNTYVNIMPQYRPCGTAYKNPSFSRHISIYEYKQAIQMAQEEGIIRFDKRFNFACKDMIYYDEW